MLDLFAPNPVDFRDGSHSMRYASAAASGVLATVPIDREKVSLNAQKFVEKKRLDRAIAEYQKIVQEEPNDTRTLLKIGDLQARANMFEAAIATYESVARHYAAQGFSVKAIAVYKQVREIIRKHVPQLAEQYGHIIPKLAQLYEELGLMGDALSAYDEYAAYLQRAGRDWESIDVFRRIVEINGNNPLTRLRLAEALLRQNEANEALAQFSKAAETLLEMGRTDDALKVIERMNFQKPDPVLARRAAEIYLGRGGEEDGMLALAKLQICFQADNRDLKTLLLLARAFETIGQAPKATEVRKELARIARDKGDFAIAKDTVHALLKEAPQDEVVHELARTILAFEQSSLPPPAHRATQSSAQKKPPVEDAVIEVSEEPIGISHSQLPIESEAAPFVHVEAMPSLPPGLDAGTLSHDSNDDDLEAASIVETNVGPPDQGVAPQAQQPHANDNSYAASYIGSVHGGALQGGNLQGGNLQSGRAQQSSTVDASAYAQVPQEQQERDASVVAREQQYAMAIAQLRHALDANPNAFELRFTLKDCLVESGDIAGACNVLMGLSGIYLDALDVQSAAQLLSEVLYLDSTHVGARNLLASLGYDVSAIGVAGTSAHSEPIPANDGASADPLHFEKLGSYSPSTKEAAPLPSYDLEEINPLFAMSTVPRSMDQSGYQSLSNMAGPFSSIDGTRPSGEPSAYEVQPAVRNSLPSFPISAHDGLAGPIDRAASGLLGEAAPASECPRFTPEQDQLYFEPSVDESQGAPLARTFGFRGSDSLEDALEEAEFFASRGLFDDAMGVLEEQGRRFPGHPLLVERTRELADMIAERRSSQSLIPPMPQEAVPDDHALEIDASLAALDSVLSPTRVEAPNVPKRSVDAEAVFATFKERVREEVSDNDSQTHYDLGAAYKEMGLLTDAVNEYTLAAKDPHRECVCWSMIGFIRAELGDMPGAVDAFTCGLRASHKTEEQEIVLCFELGAIHEKQNKPKDALRQFEKVLRKDPKFRDVAARVQALKLTPAPQSKKPPSINKKLDQKFDREFEQEFDDLFGASKFSR